jgi:hypothetical protein
LLESSQWPCGRSECHKHDQCGGLNEQHAVRGADVEAIEQALLMNIQLTQFFSLWRPVFENPRVGNILESENKPYIECRASYFRERGEEPPEFVTIFTDSPDGEAVYPQSDTIRMFCDSKSCNSVSTFPTGDEPRQVAWVDDSNVLNGLICARVQPGPLTLKELDERLMQPVREQICFESLISPGLTSL